MERKVSVIVKFEFTTQSEDTKEVKEDITEQIVQDTNAYYQNPSETAQITTIQILKWGAYPFWVMKS